MCTYIRTCMCEGGIPRQGVENLFTDLIKERDVCVCERGEIPRAGS